MPDGDRFERRLRGKAWRQAYRLACRGEDDTELARLLRNATEQALRDGLEGPALGEVASVLHKALGKPLFATMDSVDREFELSQQLDAIAVSHPSFPGTRLAVEEAKKVYAQINSCRQAVTVEQVQQQLREKFVARIVDNEFFSRVRQSLQEKTGRNNQEQAAWERQIAESVNSYKRTRRRVQSQPSWGIEQLNQPIAVLEA